MSSGHEEHMMWNDWLKIGNIRLKGDRFWGVEVWKVLEPQSRLKNIF